MNAKKLAVLLAIVFFEFVTAPHRLFAASYTAACGVPFCYNGNHLIYASAYPSKRCGEYSGNGEHGGVYQCDHQNPDPLHATCHVGLGADATTCWRYKTCAFLSDEATTNVATASAAPASDITAATLAIAATQSAGYADEFDPRRSREDWVFEPDYAGFAGDTGFRCGKYARMSPPWWQVFNGNIYAQETIEHQYPNADDAGVITCQRPSQYVLAKLNPNDVGATAGLQMSEDVGNFTTLTNFRTQRDNPYYPNTTTAPAHFTDQIAKQNFNYFTSLLDYGQISSDCAHPSLVNSGPDLNEISSVCQATRDSFAADLVRQITPFDVETSPGTLSPSVSSDQKIVIFVNGNLHINSSIDVRPGGFLAFIVSGDIIFDQEFGNEIIRLDPANQEHVDGVYLADGVITFEKREIRAEMDPFNDRPYCDKQAILRGTFVALGSGGIQLNRTFKACYMMDESEEIIDYNCANPAIIIQYRPDFLTNTPTWMKQTQTLRLEGV